MQVRWQVGVGVRCDLVAYGAKNLAGKRQVVQIFPSGSRQGVLDGSDVRSVVVRAVPGTRVIFAASQRDSWELAAWRCVRVLDGSSMPSEVGGGLSRVRVPDLDALDPWSARRTDPDVQEGYPVVDSVQAGTGWTFGGGGVLAGRVGMVIIEKEGSDGIVVTPAERVAVAVLDALVGLHPDALPPALDAACEAVAREASDAAVERLRERYGGP